MSSESNSASGVLVTGSRNLKRPFTVAVEGNIGSGKSTFLDYCSSKPDVVVYREPVEQWQNVNGSNLLVSIHLPYRLNNIVDFHHTQSNFYANPPRWAMACQLHVGETLLSIYNRKTWKGLKLVERSLLSSR